MIEVKLILSGTNHFFSSAVIKALQTLQGKIKKLELERAEAEEKFVKYEENSNELKKLIHCEFIERLDWELKS